MNNMLLINSEWNGRASFKMIPADLSCPFVECIYDPASKVLAVVGKTIKQSFHMVHKTDDNGDPMERKIRREGASHFKQERKLLETFNEYYLADVEDIRQFIARFAINVETFDIEKYLSVVTIDTPKPSIIVP